MTHDELKSIALERKSVKKQYDALDPEFTLLREMLLARQKTGLSQAEVAKRMGTKPPAITRFESSLSSGKHSPYFRNDQEICKYVRLSFRNTIHSEFSLIIYLVPTKTVTAIKIRDIGHPERSQRAMFPLIIAGFDSRSLSLPPYKFPPFFTRKTSLYPITDSLLQVCCFSWPQANECVSRAGNELIALSCESDCSDGIFMFTQNDGIYFKLLHIPKSDRFVGACRGQQMSVETERNSIDTILMTA